MIPIWTSLYWNVLKYLFIMISLVLCCDAPSPWQPGVTLIRLAASPECPSVMERIELDSIVPVEEVEEVGDNNSPPPYDAAVKQNNYFPEVLMHHKTQQHTPGNKRKPKRTIQSELPFLKLVWSIIFYFWSEWCELL